MIKPLFFVCLLFLFPLCIKANPPEKTYSQGERSLLSIPWMENKGQVPDDILFYTKIFAGNVNINKNGNLEYQLTNNRGNKLLVQEFFNSTLQTSIQGAQKANTLVNFFTSNDNCYSSIRSFSEIRWGELWPGIQVKLISNNSNVEKIFNVQPWANPDQIQLEIKGLTDLCVTEEGELQLDILEESIYFSKPVATQLIADQIKNVPIVYDVNANDDHFKYGFKLSDFDPSYPIHIDPLLSSTFLGGADIEEAKKLKIASNGKIYVCGITKSMNFPVTQGSYDESFNDSNSDYDIFVARFSSDLSTLEVCTYIGGNTDDNVNGIEIDENGNVIIVGDTESHDFPTTVGAYDRTHDGNKDYYSNIYISKFNSELSQLLASTYIGSYWNTDATCMAINNQNQIYIAGESGGDLPQVGPQFQDPCEGIYVIKIDNELSTILASNSIDGSITYTRDMKIGPNGNIFVTGITRDINNKLPTTIGCYDNTYASKDDIFILKLDQSLANNLGCTYLGGNNDDEGWCINFDNTGNIIIGGKTLSTDYPTTVGVYDETWDNTEFRDDGIISILSNDLKDLLTSTYLGALDSGDGIVDLMLDDAGKIYVLGESSAGFPVFCNSISNGGSGVYIAKFDQNLENLETSTYLNGWRGSDPGNFEFDQNGNIVVCGGTSSDDFPVLNAYDDSFNSDESWYNDAFISILSPDLVHGLPCCTSPNYPEDESWDILPYFTLNWDEAQDADGYYISVGIEDDLYAIINQMDVGNVLTYDISDLPCGNNIIITVDAYNENGIAIGNDCMSTSFHTIYPSIETFHDTICEGEILYWEGFPLYYEGRFRVIYENKHGCDSTLQMNLIVLESFFESTEISICEGESYEWYGTLYHETGSYYQHFSNAYGCDSIYELVLQTTPTYMINQSDAICEGDDYNWEDQILTETGNYSVTYPSQQGCDSIINLSLVVNPEYAYFDSYEMCESDSLIWEGQVIKESGSYTASYLSAEACDSILNMELTVHQDFEFFENQMICEGEELEWQGDSYSAAGEYSKHFTTQFGCDSSYYLTLKVNPNYEFEESASLCPEETIVWHDQNLVSAGQYEAHYFSKFGCDSSYYLSLSQTTIDTSVIISGDQLQAVYDENASYQWLRCPDYEIIEGATEVVFNADESGNYAVLIELANCSDTSYCHSLIHSKINEINSPKIRLYPNPVIEGRLHLETDSADGDYTVVLYSLNGTQVLRLKDQYKHSSIDVSTLPAGIYFLKWLNKDRKIVKKVMIQN